MDRSKSPNDASSLSKRTSLPAALNKKKSVKKKKGVGRARRQSKGSPTSVVDGSDEEGSASGRGKGSLIRGKKKKGTKRATAASVPAKMGKADSS